MNLDRLEKWDEKEVTPEKLLERGIVRDLKAGLKVLGDGKLKKALRVVAHRFSAGAKQKIEAAGGEAVVR